MSQENLDRTLAATSRPAADSPPQRRSHASLVVLQGKEIGRDFRLRRGTMMIGRGIEADIRIPDDLASRRHARIDCTWDQQKRIVSFHLVDLQSTNLTLVNSHRIDRAVLSDGDKIQIGDTVLKFVLLDDVEVKFHAEVRNRLSYDQLSGLLTRESFCLALEIELKRCDQYDIPLAVLMMDLDHFKSVNDTHGHLVGSAVLAEVGRVIRKSIRGVDAAARYGGEEFVAYLTETSVEDATSAALRLCRAIEEHEFLANDTPLRITTSIGVSLFPEHGRNFTSLVESADKALYRAKDSGRNRVCFMSQAA